MVSLRALALTLAFALPARAAGLASEPGRDDGLLPPPEAPPTGDRGEKSAEKDTGKAKRKPGPQTVFYRADDFAALGAQSFAADYAIESGRHYGDSQKPFGVLHRVQAAYGATRWLKLSAEQNMKSGGEQGGLRVGVFAPQLRLTLLGMLPPSAGPWPLDVSAFFGPRYRIQGRREPSVVFGLGSNTPKGPFHFTINEALEVTRSNPDKGIESQMGPRYDLGVGYEVGAGFVPILEVWGHAAWSRGGYVEQEHHAGPSLLYTYGPARVSLGGGAGWQEQAGTKLWDLRAMLTTGLEI